LHGGGSPMSPIIARQLLSRMGSANKIASQAVPKQAASQLMMPAKLNSDGLLTEREEQVLQFLSRGYSYGELAKQMGVTINTIQTHIRGLYTKLEVHSKSQAVFQARQRGFLDK
jgi:DNA-binding NarL/FixJ family response regulator